MEQAAELRELVSSRDVPADIATRGRIVLWSAEGRRRKDIAELLGVSLPTVDRWKRRYAEHGVAGLEGDRPGGAREQVPARVRARVIALTRMTPPDGTGLSHWSTRELAKYLKRTEDVTVSWHYIARIWREENLKPRRSGTFKISKDPAFAERVTDIVGLYLDPPGGAVVLSLDEKTQVQALDRTQPVLPVTFDATEKRTHDYIRHGTTNLFAALNVATGQVLGECKTETERCDVPGVPEEGGQAARGEGDPHCAGQPVHAHHPGREGVAGEKPARALPLHPGRLLVAEPDRDLVRDHHPTVDPPRYFLQRPRPRPADPRLHRLLERERETLHLDRDRRGGPRQGPTRHGQRQETRQQR
ncbi:IS630 family transposase [Streptomyces sp. NBC_01788]|nr:IS630 family transposase [Streptomyces sp. NBC_01788]WSB25602.1 IS630 family transposase [Streptomyces sp. NBC_01788]